MSSSSSVLAKRIGPVGAWAEDLWKRSQANLDQFVQSTVQQVRPQGAATKMETLCRATYMVAPDKAAALESFLQLHLSDQVRVERDGGNLTVTASPRVQSALNRFIALLAPPSTGQDGGSSESHN